MWCMQISLSEFLWENCVFYVQETYVLGASQANLNSGGLITRWARKQEVHRMLQNITLNSHSCRVIDLDAPKAYANFNDRYYIMCLSCRSHRQTIISIALVKCISSRFKRDRMMKLDFVRSSLICSE